MTNVERLRDYINALADMDAKNYQVSGDILRSILADLEHRDRLLAVAKEASEWIADNDCNEFDVCDHCGMTCDHAADCPLMVLVDKLTAALSPGGEG